MGASYKRERDNNPLQKRCPQQLFGRKEMRKLAVIGGSQAYSLMQAGKLAGERIPPLETPFGESQPILRLQTDAGEMLFMSRHGEHGYSIAPSWINYRANIWALKELGTTAIVSWSGPGAIDESLRIGQFVLPDDILDETRFRPQTFFEGTGLGFVRQNPVFCPALAESIATVLKNLGLVHRIGGTYVCTEGPRLETPAEIRKYRLMGADMVGMTLAPEVFLARELEMCYAPICYITNYAEGVRERFFAPGVLFEGLLDNHEKASVEQAVVQFPGIIASLSSISDRQSVGCRCARSMERYRLRGDIGPDWHSWIRR
jgi:5'-methylthioadenosine phosphorylase